MNALTSRQNIRQNLKPHGAQAVNVEFYPFQILLPVYQKVNDPSPKTGTAWCIRAVGFLHSHRGTLFTKAVEFHLGPYCRHGPLHGL